LLSVREAQVAFFAGFDTEVFPGLDCMTWLRANSNLRWCGYYLAPAPNRSPTGWPGRYEALKADWGVVPIYVGQQDPRTATAHYKPSSLLTAERGAIDAGDAVKLAWQDQFPGGTFVYLDWEYGGLDGAGARDYVKAWAAAVAAEGTFMPGVYCSHNTASGVVKLLNTIDPAPAARLWCWKVPSADNHPYLGDLGAVPAPDPAGCGFAGAIAWQRDQNTTVTLPDGAPAKSLKVDFSTAASADPAAPPAARA